MNSYVMWLKVWDRDVSDVIIYKICDKKVVLYFIVDLKGSFKIKKFFIGLCLFFDFRIEVIDSGIFLKSVFMLVRFVFFRYYM